MDATVDDDRALLATLRAEREIKAALTRFCRGADRRDYDLLRTAFHDDAWDDHGPYAGDIDGFIAWQKTRHATIPQCMHFLGNCTIEIEGPKAFVETYCIAVLHAPSEEGGFAKTSLACRYIDVFEHRGPGWRIAHRRVVYDWFDQTHIEQVLPDGVTLPRQQRSQEDVIYHLRRQTASVPA